MSLAELIRLDQLAVLKINNPPVNAISEALHHAMEAAFDEFEADNSLRALVVECEGRTFLAGGDIAGFEKPDFTTAPFNAFLARIEACDRPVVAALFGTVLGGGLEFAMSCHARIAHPATKVGLPEVALGLIPGSLGTQRLPRLAGLEKGLEMISTGNPVGATEALKFGIVNRVEEEFVTAARAEALRMAQDASPLRRTSDLTPSDLDTALDVIVRARKAAQAEPWLPAMSAIVACIEAAANLPFAEGEQVEADEFRKIVHGPASRALRHMFFAQRTCRKVPDLPRDLTERPIQSVGVVGAGTMGTGIAMSCANAGFDVWLVEKSPEVLERSLSTISASNAARVAKGRLTNEAAQARQSRISASTNMSDLSEVDLVIEAVFEDMDLKCAVMRELDQICKTSAILATNTSTLDVDRIAAVTSRPGDVIGTHFFSPAHVMRLLEIVRGAQTAPDVLHTILKLADRIGKVPVVSGVCFGFIGNRMLDVYLREVEMLLLEGATPEHIDRVAQSPEHIGLAMGPCRMMDMAGVDVGARAALARLADPEGPDEPNYRALSIALYEKGDFGQKTGQGFYRHEGRAAHPSDDLNRLCEELATKLDVQRRETHDDAEICERLLLPLINEGFAILEEGIALRESDIDVVYTTGYGFPSWRGGPMFMAREIGLDKIVSRMQAYLVQENAADYWHVTPRLQREAELVR